MPVESTDDDLMWRVATRNDSDAFDALFVRHRRSVYAFALRLLGPGCATNAENVTQEMFLRLWQARRAYRFERASLRTYLLTITRRLVLDDHKRRGMSELPLADTDLLSDRPERAAMERERNEALERTIAVLIMVSGNEMPVAQRSLVICLTPRQRGTVVLASPAEAMGGCSSRFRAGATRSIRCR